MRKKTLPNFVQVPGGDSSFSTGSNRRFSVIRDPQERLKTFDYTEVTRRLKPVKIIHFEDDMQDFLRWYVAGNGVVVCSEPFQTNIWAGYVVIRAIIGQEPLVRNHEGGTRKVRHRVDRIEHLT